MTRPLASRDSFKKPSNALTAVPKEKNENPNDEPRVTPIMGSIQLGIEHAIEDLEPHPKRDLLMNDFNTVDSTFFPSKGTSGTKSHKFPSFTFHNYAPVAFKYFRELFDIHPGDFLKSVCRGPLKELSGLGASGSLFYLTRDDEFIIKTVQPKEAVFLQRLLPDYYMNLQQNSRTLLPKFFGLYCYKLYLTDVKLIIMNNLLPSSVRMHQKYDLKGSTHRRKASETERLKLNPTYKDLDFMEHHPEGIILETDTYDALMNTINRDCRVLESFNIMDYSLLLMIHNLDQEQRSKKNRSRNTVLEEDANGDWEELSLDATDGIISNIQQRLVAHSTATESIQALGAPPGGIPARNSKGDRLLLFVGIIDILQSYTFAKKMEHSVKSMVNDGNTISVHDPKFYSNRFQNFMKDKVFKKKYSPTRIQKLLDILTDNWQIIAATMIITLAATLFLTTALNRTTNNDQIYSTSGRRSSKNPHRHISRDQWGAILPLHEDHLTLPVDLVIITHTLTPVCDDLHKCSRLLQSTQKFDFRQGLSDVADNFFIDGDGNIYEGRGWNCANDRRKESISVGFIGNFFYDDLKDSSTEALMDLLSMGVEFGKLSMNYNLVSHNQTSDTLNPGDNVYEVLKTLSHFKEGKLS